VADSECIGGDHSDPEQRCVPMEFQGVARSGGFCLRRRIKTCVRPYLILITAESLSGAASEEYCGIDQEATRCEAVLDLFHSSACPDGQDSSCGCSRDTEGNCTDAGAGGLCRTVGVFATQCTYQCGALNDCFTGLTCGGDSPMYCR
jgi:hypothetical protein